MICLKHQGKGPLTGELIGHADGIVVYHAPVDDNGLSRLGYLFVETGAHVPSIADLDDASAAALGRLRTRLARALKDELGAEFVIAVVIGLGVDHFHEHLIARMPGTPRDLPWHQTAESLPLVGREEVARLAARLRQSAGLSSD